MGTATGRPAVRERVGFIGLGDIGSLATRQLLHRGFDVTVFDTRPGPVGEAVAAGAQGVDDLGQFDQCSIVLLCLPGPVEFLSVLFDEEGLTQCLSPGALIIDLTTNSPHTVRDAARRLAAAGIDLADAPVSGGIVAAERGDLAIAFGGSEDAFERSGPILGAISSTCIHVGDVGNGNVCKLVHNMGSQILRQALAEMFTIATKAGVDPTALHQFVEAGSFGRGTQLRRLPERVFTRQFKSQTFARHAMNHKDIRLAIELAEELAVPSPVGSVCLGISQEATDRGWDESDSWITFAIQEQLAGVMVTPKRAT